MLVGGLATLGITAALTGLFADTFPLEAFVVVGALLVGGLLAARAGFVRGTAWASVWGLMFLLLLFAIGNGGVVGVGGPLLVLGILMSGILLGANATPAAGAFCAASMSAVYFAQARGLLPAAADLGAASGGLHDALAAHWIGLMALYAFAVVLVHLMVSHIHAAQRATRKVRHQAALAHHALDHKRLLLDHVVASMHEMLLLVNADGTVRYANPAALDLLGYAAHDVQDMPLSRLVISHHADPSQPAIDSSDPGRQRVERLFRTKDGRHVPVLYTTVSIPDDNGGRYTMCVATDITHRKRAEEDQQRAEAVIDEVRRSRNDFLTSVTHELRSPLHEVIGATEALSDFGVAGGSPRLHTDLGRIQRTGKRLLSLIDDVLDLSELDAGEVPLRHELFDLNALVSELADAVAPIMLRRGNRLVLQVEPGLGRVRSDPDRVRQVVYNLLANAARLTERGTVAFTVRRADADHVVFAVADTGAGMSPDELTRALRPIRRAEAPTALELTLCRRIAERLGADLDATSELGVGSKFTFSLPARAETTRQGGFGFSTG